MSLTANSARLRLLTFLTSDISSQSFGRVATTSQLQSPKEGTLTRNNCDLNKLKEALLAVKDSNEYPPPSMAELAKRLNYNVRFLRRHFKELCADISAQYVSYRKELHKNRIKQSCILVQQTALDMYAEGEEPTRSRVASRLNKPAYFREQEVCAALSEVRRQLGLEQ